jgi:hypothetical protein
MIPSLVTLVTPGQGEDMNVGPSSERAPRPKEVLKAWLGMVVGTRICQGVDRARALTPRPFSSFRGRTRRRH